MRGIITVGEGMSFDDIDALLGQDDSGFVTTLSPDSGGAEPLPSPMVTSIGPSDQSTAPDQGIVTSLPGVYNPNVAVPMAPAPAMAPPPPPTYYRPPPAMQQAITPMAPQQGGVMPPGPVVPNTTQSILTAFNQVATPAASAYGSYSTLRLGPVQPAKSVVPMLPRPAVAPTAAPASTGLSPMTLAMIGGGALLFLGFVFVLTRS